MRKRKHGLLYRVFYNTKRDARKFLELSLLIHIRLNIILISYRLENLFGSTICIEDMINLPENIKQALCTELYIQLLEPKLLRNMTNSVVWNCLLLYNKIDTIKYWIDKRYNANAITEGTYEIDENLRDFIDNLTITPEMIEQINLSDANNLIKDLTKNHLCKYV